MVRLIALAVILSASLPVDAADAAPKQPGGVWRAALDAGPLVFVLVVVIAVLCSAVAIHIAAGFTGLPNRGFGRACKAAGIGLVLTFVIPFVFGLMLGLFGVKSQATLVTAYVLSAILPGTLAIRSAYEAGFVSSLVTFVVAAVVTVLIVVGSFFGLNAVLGTS